jgi:ABC-type sugar transport system permease subunit
MTSLRFNTSQLTGAASFLGPFCFSLFIFLVVFICLSMFLSIINQNFRQARKNLNKNNGQQIYSFMFDRFQRWIGLKKQTQEEIHEERDAVMRAQYFDPIEHLPEKIDQLLDALNRVCLTLYPGTARRGESRRGIFLKMGERVKKTF